ncbi:hypothetical protein Tsubulata_004838 [Turnera subulata]|uniref:PB1 domain-containing protein n=1 Tax=Turnera subulata TaxID=218843 RepID=A0A9Q0GGQ8_9ROSI|nr:hypothetical protein Tsubulata_004838 [Turnera subulata]
MPREKLILICQFGGSFVTKDDGSISYDGGEAHALDINRETLFDTLKLKLAEICNFEYNSLSMKYFLPGNNRTLITLSNDKDLKRMYDFYGKAITAELFVMGKLGFDREAHRISTSRETGIKLAEKVTATVQPQSTATTHVAVGSPSTPVVSTRKVSRAAATPRRRHAPSSNSPETVTGTAPIPTSVVLALTSKRLPKRAATKNISDANFCPVDDVAAPDADFVNVPIMFDMNSTPADTVKKRRRTASWKIGANGPTIVAGADTDTDSDVEIITPRSRKRNKETVDVFVEADESEQQLEETYNPLNFTAKIYLFYAGRFVSGYKKTRIYISLKTMMNMQNFIAAAHEWRLPTIAQQHFGSLLGKFYGTDARA